MGGKAFRAEGLYTPRMPPDIYNRCLQEVLQKLRKVFSRVETPIDAPGKLDHGDIDILAVPIADIPTSHYVAEFLGAKHFKNIPNNPTTHFAIPWPEEIETIDGDCGPDKLNSNITSLIDHTVIEDNDERLHTTVLGENGEINGSVTHIHSKPRFIQIDLHICKNTIELDQLLFTHAHGDLHRMLGAIVRRFGITFSESGLYIRIAELEAWNKNEARVRLTDTPEDTLKYLGLDVERFWKPFTTLKESMIYAASCRFHDPAQGMNDDLQEQKHIKRRHGTGTLTRPMLTYWIQKYLPLHCDDSPGSAAHMTREDVIEEAKRLFGQQWAENFDRQRNSGIQIMGLQRLWAEVRKEIEAEGSELTYAMKGLKREITTIPDDDSIKTQVQDDYVAGRFDAVKIWCLQHWKEVGKRQETFDRIQSAEKYREKLGKEIQKKDVDTEGEILENGTVSADCQRQ